MYSACQLLLFRFKIYAMHYYSKQRTYCVQFFLYETSMCLKYLCFSSSLAGIGMTMTC